MAIRAPGALSGVSFDAAAIARAIEARLAEVGTPERAAAEKRYLRSDLAFLGASVPDIRAAVRHVAGARRLDRNQLFDLAVALWSVPVHERRMAAVILLERHERLLSPADLPLLERLLREARTWALVDGLATAAVGGLVSRHEAAVTSALDTWARDSDFWLRRASLLAELRRLRAGAPLDRFVRRAEPMLEEQEFFIRKAIGWVLREAGRRDPDAVARWLAPRAARASGVTMREAVKYLPADVAADLMRRSRATRARCRGSTTRGARGRPA